MLYVKQRAKNIEGLSKIVDEMENNDSFSELKNDLKEFKEEFLKQLYNENKIKEIQQSKNLSELKNIKKNG